MIYLGVEYGTTFHLEGPHGQTVVFNDSTDPNFVGILDPESSGLDAPEIREDSNDRVESDGAIFGDFFSGKRPIVLQGRIIATSKAQRNERVGKLRAASLAKATDATLWWEDPVAGKVFVNVRRQQPLRVTKGYVKEFQLALVAADSRILFYGLQSAEKTGVVEASQEKSPGNVKETFPGAEKLAFTNPENAKANDAAYVTVTNSSAVAGFLTAYLQAKNYGFTIPANAGITAVEPMVKLKAATASKWEGTTLEISNDIENVALLEEQQRDGSGFDSKGKIPGNPYFEKAIATTEETRKDGGPSAGANRMIRYEKYLTPAKINTEKFGMSLRWLAQISAGTLSINWMPIKIYYVEPPEVTVVNEGDVPAPAIIKVTGPYENFLVRNEATGEIIYYTGKVEANKEIWFDTENITVTEHGTGITEPISRFANVGYPNDFIQIQPGSNRLLVAGSGGSSKTKLKVEWRHAWE